MVMGIFATLLWLKAFMQGCLEELGTCELLRLTLLTDTLQHKLCAVFSSRRLAVSLEADLAKFHVVSEYVNSGSNLVPSLLASFIPSFPPYLI